MAQIRHKSPQNCASYIDDWQISLSISPMFTLTHGVHQIHPFVYSKPCISVEMTHLGHSHVPRFVFIFGSVMCLSKEGRSMHKHTPISMCSESSSDNLTWKRLSHVMTSHILAMLQNFWGRLFVNRKINSLDDLEYLCAMCSLFSSQQYFYYSVTSEYTNDLTNRRNRDAH